MVKLECEFIGGCVVQRLSTALEDIPFMDQLSDRAASLGKPEEVVDSSFNKGDLIDTAEELSNTSPCKMCSDQLRSIHTVNIKRLKNLRRQNHCFE